MEENNFFGLESKIQKIIQNYQDLKVAYNKVKMEKDDLETKQLEALEAIDQKDQEIQNLKSSNDILKTELTALRTEKDNAINKISDYESKAKEAALKLDGLFASLDIDD